MSRLRSALANFGIGFLIAFVVVSVFKNRHTGVKAGVVWGTVSAVLGWLIAGKLAVPEHPPVARADGHEFDQTGTSD